MDDTSFSKKGKHSVGVARQYSGVLGKQDNCQVAVSVLMASELGSVPVSWQLYLPKDWAEDQARRQKAGIPDAIGFITKPKMALAHLKSLLAEGLPKHCVLANAGYGVDTAFRRGLDELGLTYVVGITSTVSVWPPDVEPLPPKPYRGKGRPPLRPRRSAKRQPMSVKELAKALPESAYRTVAWRQGTNQELSNRFAAVRVRHAGGNAGRARLHPRQWLRACPEFCV